MLTEAFIASTGVLTGSSPKLPVANRDLGIYLHEHQPQPRIKSTFKKSNTRRNGLAVSASHVFAAQVEGAVVHVYDREGGRLEAVIPFSEAIECLVFVGNYNNAGIIALGTTLGRLLLWEAGISLCTGRLVQTPRSHLKATTCIAVDPVSNFLLTGSEDATICVWSLPNLLSFTKPSNHDPNQLSCYSAIHTLTKHRASVTSIVTGHNSGRTNIAVSASLDKTCLVWDYHNGNILHTFLFASAPLCIALDPVDRALYAGLEDGSIQLVDFYEKARVLHPLWDPTKRAIPTQPPACDRWSLSSNNEAAVQCLATNYDGTILLSGHDNGKIHTWDIAKGHYAAQLADFSSNVTNLHILPPSGFPKPPRPPLIIHHVTKPRFESTFSRYTSMPASKASEDYTFSVQFANTIALSSTRADPMLSFDTAISDPLLHGDIVCESLIALATGSSATEQANFLDDPSYETAAMSMVKKDLSCAVDVIQIYSEKIRALEGEILRRDQEKRRQERLIKIQNKSVEMLEDHRRRQEMGVEVEEIDWEATQVDTSDSEATKIVDDQTKNSKDGTISRKLRHRATKIT